MYLCFLNRHLFVFFFCLRYSVYKIDLKYRDIYKYWFRRGTSAAETVRRVNDVYVDGRVAKENTVHFWLQHFRFGYFDLQEKPRRRPETQVANEKLKVVMEVDP